MQTTGDPIQEAARLAQAGERQQAVKCLVSLLKKEPANLQAWWILGVCQEEPGRMRECFGRVLRLNPQHYGARVFLNRLNNSLPLPDIRELDLTAGEEEPGEPGLPVDGYADTSPFSTPIPPVEDDPEIARLIEAGRAAEKRKDFQAGYYLYDQVLDMDSSHLFAWLGKGYCAGRLSNAENNRIPEFFDCLTRAILARDILGLEIKGALAHLDPIFAQEASDCLLRLSSHAAQLALTSPQPMANVYAVERVHLTDWAYAIGRRLNTQAGLWCSRAELIGVANDAFRRIVQNVIDTHRSARSRLETIQMLRNYLLSKLSTSGIHTAPDFLQGLDEIASAVLQGSGNL